MTSPRVTALRALVPLRRPRTLSLLAAAFLRPSEALLTFWTTYRDTYQAVIRPV